MVTWSRRQQWGLLAAGASAVAAPLAERAVAAAWRFAAREDPPADPVGRDVDWGRALLWTAAAAVAVALAQVAARRGAALAWTRVTGTQPPHPRRRPRHRRRRLARG